MHDQTAVRHGVGSPEQGARDEDRSALEWLAACNGQTLTELIEELRAIAEEAQRHRVPPNTPAS